MLEYTDIKSCHDKIYSDHWRVIEAQVSNQWVKGNVWGLPFSSSVFLATWVIVLSMKAK